ncbi:pentapeptide repeat-containing protein [Listeria booriae]|uniref:pentapeptide repeat-containing protein n=1 Tax=Listeria booriae TaxID=1552123 RepID=UPI0016262047|nr:pentapeptide repeat-containing protein [Listeria booriae]MBC2196854.1 pentapeptide repeat-containing protein [Listeria booriae]
MRRMLRSDVLNFLNNRKEDGEKVSLTNCDLSGLDLSHLDLCNVDFTGSNLDNSNLSYSDIQNAMFSETSINGIRGLNIYAIHGVSNVNESIYYHPATNQVWCKGKTFTLQEFKEEYAVPSEDFANEYVLAEFQSAYLFFSSIETITNAKEAEENSFFVDEYDAEKFTQETIDIESEDGYKGSIKLKTKIKEIGVMPMMMLASNIEFHLREAKKAAAELATLDIRFEYEVIQT